MNKPTPLVDNNIGALRLLFAYIVIISHSGELLDGNRLMDASTQPFGALSCGAFAVDGFFLISGYLITKSFENSGSVAEYLWKRVIRIYPGYAVAFVFSLLVIGPLAGGDIGAMTSFMWAANLRKMLFLQVPQMSGAFARNYVHSLNSSMWTISYEFRCYLLVAALGFFGLLLKRRWIAAASAGLLALTTVNAREVIPWPHGLKPITGDLNEDVRFVATFGCGACFYLFRTWICFDWRLAAISGAVLTTLLWAHAPATLAVAIFGGYVIFWFAFRFRSKRLATIGSRTDLSYGVYLYAFPIQNTLIFYCPGIFPWLVTALASGLASIFALFSWRLVEKPALGFKRLPIAPSANLSLP